MWYREYLDLRAKQKEAIKGWRSKKSTKSPLLEKTSAIENKASATTVKTEVLNREAIQEKLETWKVFLFTKKKGFGTNFQNCRKKNEENRLNNSSSSNNCF